MAQHKFKDRYDWVVMGDHPGALLAGCLAARSGFSVLMAPLGPSAGVVRSKRDLPLDRESNWILGLGRGQHMNGLVSQCLSQIGFSPAEGEKILQPRAPFTVASSRLRFNVESEADQLLKELNRELGEGLVSQLGIAAALQASHDAIIEHWFQLPERLRPPEVDAQGRKRRARWVGQEQSRREFYRRLSKSGSLSSREQRAWFIQGKQLHTAMPAVLGGRTEAQELIAGLRCGTIGITSTSNELSRLGMLEALEGVALSTTAARFEGGLSKFRKFLREVAKRSGATVSEEAEISQVFVEAGRFVGVQLAHQGNMISCSNGLVGCAWEHAQKKISSSGGSWLRRPAQAPKPSGWKFSIAVIARSEALPTKISDRVIWLEDGAPAIEFELSDCESYEHAEAGSRLIFCRTVLPYSKDALNPRSLRLVAARMFRKLCELFPFVEFHVSSVFPDFRLASPLALDEISEAFPYHLPSDLPEALRVYSGVQGLKTRSGIEGLFIASEESYPEWGSLGAVSAGLEALSRVTSN